MERRWRIEAFFQAAGYADGQQVPGAIQIVEVVGGQALKDGVEHVEGKHRK
jgi:hypothetical protein